MQLAHARRIWSALHSSRCCKSMVWNNRMDHRPTICKSCDALIIDLLTGDVLDQRHWTLVQSDLMVISRFHSHLDGTIDTLEQSSRSCVVCKLFLAQTLSLSKENTSTYNIYIQGRAVRNSEVNIALGDINRFVRLPSTERESKRLVIARRPSHVSALATRLISGYNAESRLRRLPVLSHTDLNSIEALGQVEDWLKGCTTEHERCRRSATKLPLRTIDLSRLRQEQRLALHISEGETDRYATLSYVWGSGDHLRLESLSDEDGLPQQKLVKRQPRSILVSPISDEDVMFDVDDIPLNSLPDTLKHAVQIADHLSFRYIWIDAMCIVQNDLADWTYHSTEMTNIYGNSELTISASSSSSSAAGIFQKVQDNYADLFNAECGGTTTTVCIGARLPVIDIDDKHISTRAWTFQERLVSPATIHFTDEGITWECVQAQEVGHSQALSQMNFKSQWQDLRSTADAPGCSRADLFNVWYLWITVYSERNITVAGERLSALAGVARAFAKHLYGEDQTHEYLAGLWKEDLLSGLLWRRDGSTPSLFAQEQVTSPSWSWVSAYGRIQFPTSREWVNGEALQIVHLCVEEGLPYSFGKLKSAILIVKGWLQRITIDRDLHPTYGSQPYRECGVVEGFVTPGNVLCMLDEWSASDERYHTCWCLRIGSQTLAGDKLMDHFLLLRSCPGEPNEYTRIGTAWCSEYYHIAQSVPHSGIFTSPALTGLVIR